MEKSVPLGFRLPALLFPLLFFVPALPPFVDYPQHMALAGALRRLGDPASFAHTLYEANLFTYNGLFDELAALASSLVGVEVAGRVLIVVSLELFVLGTFALFRRQRADAISYLLLVPLLPSFSLFWGFTNYLLGVGLGAIFVALLARTVGSRNRRAAPNLCVAVVALVMAHAHVLAAIVSLLMGGAWILDEALRDEKSGWKRLGRLTHGAVLAAPACVFCVAVHVRQFATHRSTYSVSGEVGFDSVGLKILWFGSRITGALRSHHDAWLAWGAVAVAIVASVAAIRNAERRRVGLPLFVMAAAYRAVPNVFVGTYLVYPRLALSVAALLLSVVPELSANMSRYFTGISAMLAVCTFFVTGAALVRFDAVARDLQEVLRALPAHAHVTAVHAATTTDGYELPVLQHVAAYHVATRDAHAAGLFGAYASLPLRFLRDDGGPRASWLEGDGHLFSLDDPYAKRFPVRLVVLANEHASLPLWAQTNHRLIAVRGQFVALEEQQAASETDAKHRIP